MVEYDRTQEREYAQQARAKICVAGVGGAGLNVLDRISLDRLVEATLLGMHTDVRVLSHAMAPIKIQLGTDLMRGIGSGGDPELGREAAQLSREQIKNAVQGHEMVFICCGLGGGTGSGAAPIVSEVAKECGAMVIVFATMPFGFEGRRRLRQGELALEELQQTADALVLFENNRMGELVLPKEGIQKAFSQADQLMGQSVRAISSMVTQPGLVRVGIADLMTALRSPNARCLFGFGEARGANRVTEALKRALKSPLVNQGQLLQSARNLLVHVTGGESLSLAEVESLMKQLGKYVPESTQILFGLSVDQKLGDSIALTLLSSLSVQEMALEAQIGTAEKVVPRETRTAESFSTILQPATDLPLTNGNGKHKIEPAPAPAAKAAKPRVTEPVAPAPAAPVQVIMPIADLFAANSSATEPEMKAQPLAAETDFVADHSAAKVEEPVLKTSFVVDESLEIEEVEDISHNEPEVVVEFAKASVSAQHKPCIEVSDSVVESHSTQPVVEGPAMDAKTEALCEEAPQPPVIDHAPKPSQEEHPVAKAAEQVPVRKEAEQHSMLNAILRPSVQIPVGSGHLVKPSIFAVIDDEDQNVGAQEQQPVSQKNSQPVRDIPASNVVLASSKQHEVVQRAPKDNEVVSRTPAATPPARRPVPPVLSGGDAPDSYEQSSLKLTQEEIARFKGTEKTIVGGEDLDVPTWMRMRQKVRR